MSITNKEVKYVADLAHLQLTEEETSHLKSDMNRILDYMETLNELDTSGIEPLEHVTELDAGFRKDIATLPISHEDALKNAPDADSDYFRVPRVIE